MAADAPEVAIVDRVTLSRADAGSWIERMHRDYRPTAEARGLELAAVWQTHADEPGSVDVFVLWTLPGPGAFFRSRATSHEASAWWRDTDALARHRERHVMQAIPAP